MKRIPNIELTEQQVKELITKHKINFGAESIICEGNKSYTLFKIFTKNNFPIQMSDNKEKKILKLYELSLEHTTIPLATISMNGILIGYVMLNFEEYRTYKLYEFLFNKETLLHYLKEVRKILDSFDKYNIIYGDMNERNILFNIATGHTIFCDMDNAQIDNLPIDKYPFSICQYRDIRGIDKGIHPYTHNQMLLRAFELDEYFITNAHIRKLFKIGAKKIIESMKNPEIFNDKYLMDYIKRLK